MSLPYSCTSVLASIFQLWLCLQAEDAATDMGGQTKAAVAAAEAVLQESATAVAKQLQRAIPEAHNMFSEADAAPAAEDAAQPSARQDEEGSLDVSASDSDAEVRYSTQTDNKASNIHRINTLLVK